ncbi:uncharacterized protein LOC106637442 isoform X2 [Copidosoma floridanum]|uniref:uncharacterized protein LOC106637442 isoform X2 n=1 Tax=Copidosoma floridanum TaxID=29053 RepID=UPI0006C93F5E|nr:uncharacterized protein LOC106637442 isoform X2 [Copidosoma floridanum]
MADDQQQKLFRLPGTIEEEEDCEREHLQDHQQNRSSRPESPLLATRNNIHIVSAGIPKNVTLLRVNTQSSSIAGITRQDSSRYRAGPARKLRRRAVLKSGECNVLQSRISRRSLRFLQDIFTTLVDTQWRWTLLCFALSFVLSWLVFAGMWYLIAFTHGDFDPRHINDVKWRPCVNDLHTFTSCFLFSIETQHTIGYGGRSTTEECPEAIFVMCAQSISGVMIQALMVGIVFAKMSRPKQRTQTLLFSKQAVICQRDGELCLMFRVGDMRKSHIIGASVRAQLIRSRTTKEGEVLPHNQYELAVGADGQTANLFFIWPCTVVHRINADSPFYNMSAEDVLTERFEVVVILEGTIESTGQTTQARSSYLPQEVLWGHRFEPLVSYSKESQGYEVDYSRFNSTVQVDTPLCSGRELAEFYRLQDGVIRQQATSSPGLLMDDELASTPTLSEYRQLPSRCHHQQQHHPSAAAFVCKYPQSSNQRHANLHPQQAQRPRSFDEEKSYCPECAAAPPPYGHANRPSIKDVPQPEAGGEEEEEERRALLSKTSGRLHRQQLGRQVSSPHQLDSRKRPGFHSCQDLLQRPRASSRRYLLLALENSLGGELCSSYPSVALARKEHPSPLRPMATGDDGKPAMQTRKPVGRELQEVVVHRLLENGGKLSLTLDDRKSLRGHGSEGSCESNNSSTEADDDGSSSPIAIQRPAAFTAV